VPEDLDDQLAGVGVLAEPARRALFLHVAGQPEPVSREAAATAVGVPVHSAKFHLDRLVEEGLLDVEYRRLTGRTGPGAGRPAKLYRRSDRELSVSLPPRSYDLAAELLAAAVERSAQEEVPVGEAVQTVAREQGRRVGQASTGAGAGTGTGTGTGLDEVAAALRPLGFEPRVRDDELCLGNCPFDRLASAHTELVCGMNLAYVGGVLDGLGAHPLAPRLDPEPGLCCVKVS
jgi:predicted ArsR family transcriptional regulator